MESETEIHFRNGDLQRSFDLFEDMRQKTEFCDVTFQTGSSSISAHRVVIAASIPYFRESFSGAGNADLPVIEPSIFKCFIDYAYTHKMKMNTENVRDLLSGACHFGVEQVKEACCDFLSDRLHPENVMSLQDLACRLHCWNLVQNINCYIRKNFVAVSQTNDFLNAPFLYIKELISRDDLLVSNEEKVFEAVMGWTKASPEERKFSLPELLRRVRMPLLNLEYLTDKVGEEELIRTSIPCRDLLDEVKNHHLFPTRKPSTPSFSSMPRRMEQHTNIKQNNDTIYGLTILSVYLIQRFEDNGKKWTTIYNGVTDINACTFTSMDNEMYFFYNGKSVKYNHTEGEVTYPKRMSSPRCFPGAVCFKRKIIVCGGNIDTTVLNTVESLDPEKDEWISLRPMLKHRTGLSAATLGDYIYVLGGTDYTAVHDSVERYDSETGRWSIMSRMLTKRCIASVAAINGKIYVCGGDSSPTEGVVNCLATAEVYDPNENTWRFVSPMKTARCQVIALPHRGKLYVLGGSGNDRKHRSDVEIYDPENDKWESGPSPRHTDYFLSGAVVM